MKSWPRAAIGIAEAASAHWCWLALALVLAIGCARHASESSSSAEGYEVDALRYQGFMGNVSMPELAEDLGYLAPLKLEFIGNTISGPQDIQTVVTGDTDFGAAFNGAIINLIAAGAPLRSVVGFGAIDKDSWSGFYVLEDSLIRTAQDLIGQKVAMNTLGAHSEFMLKEYLYRNGANKAEIQQVTLLALPPINSEQTLRQRQVEVATLSGILRDKALERGGLRVLFSDYDLFGELTTASYVLRADFIAEKPRAARKFVEGVARAIEWTRSTPREDVVARFTSIIERRQRNEDSSALKYWRSVKGATKGGRISEREFQIWIDWLVRDGQLARGRIEAPALFTNELNPYAASDPPERALGAAAALAPVAAE